MRNSCRRKSLPPAACTLLVRASSFGGGFFPVIGSLLLLAFFVTLQAAVAVLLLLRKNGLAKLALGPVFAWWILNTIGNGLGQAAFIDSGFGAVVVLRAVFAFIAALTLLAAAVLFISGMCGRTKLFQPAWLLFAVYLCVGFIVLIVTCVYVATSTYLGWETVVGAIGDLAFAAGLFFAGLFMWYRTPTAEEQKTLPAAEKPAALDVPPVDNEQTGE